MRPTVTPFVTSPRSKTVILRADVSDEGAVIDASRIGRVRTVQLTVGGAAIEQDMGVTITSLSVAGLPQTLPKGEAVTRVEGLCHIMALGQTIECGVGFPGTPIPWGRLEMVVEFDELDADVIGQMVMDAFHAKPLAQALPRLIPLSTCEVFSDPSKGGPRMQRIVRVPEWISAVRVEPPHAIISLMTVAGIPVRWLHGDVDPSAWVVESPSAWSAPAGQKRLVSTGQSVAVVLENPDECPNARAVFTVESIDPAAFSAEMERIVSSV